MRQECNPHIAKFVSPNWVECTRCGAIAPFGKPTIDIEAELTRIIREAREQRKEMIAGDITALHNRIAELEAQLKEQTVRAERFRAAWNANTKLSERVTFLEEEIQALTHQGRQGELEQANVGLATENARLRAYVECWTYYANYPMRPYRQGEVEEHVRKAKEALNSSPRQDKCLDCAEPATKLGRCFDCHHKTRPAPTAQVCGECTGDGFLVAAFSGRKFDCPKCTGKKATQDYCGCKVISTGQPAERRLCPRCCHTSNATEDDSCPECGLSVWHSSSCTSQGKNDGK